VAPPTAQELLWQQHTAAVATCPLDCRPSLILAPGESVIRVSFSGSEGPTVADGWLHDEESEKWPLSQSRGGKGVLSNPSAKTLAAAGSGPSAAGQLKPPAGLLKPLRKLGAAHADAAAPVAAASAQPPPPPATEEPASAADVAVPGRVRLTPPLTLPAAIAQGGPLLSVLTTHRLLILNPALQILVAVPCVVPVSASFGSGLGAVTASRRSAGDLPASALACASYGVWQGSYSAASGSGVPMGVGSPTFGLHGSTLFASEDAEAVSSALALANGGVLSPSSETVSLGGGYMGVADNTASVDALGFGGEGTAGKDTGTGLLAFPPPWPSASPRFGQPSAGESSAHPSLGEIVRSYILF
jgi:hypothetical protein